MALKLELEVTEINTILRVLGKHPFDEVVTLISKIKQQGDAQLAEQEAAQATPTPKPKEEHFVHVISNAAAETPGTSDGSKDVEIPDVKDLEHIKRGVAIHGGQFVNKSDKGAFFKFGSYSDAQAFKQHVDDCPNKSCYANLSQATEINQ